MKRNQFLATVSAVQLCFGLGGMALAIRRRHAFDLPFWHGQESAVGRDSLLIGTALSAPAAMLGAQVGATAVLLWRPKVGAARLLGGLGAAMAAGYLAERLVRRRLLPSGWDAMESSVIVAGMSLAAVMAVVGLRFPGAESEVG